MARSISFCSSFIKNAPRLARRSVGVFHPGFNKTGMTAKYKEIWEVEGAVDPSIGAKRVFHEVGRLNIERTGRFVNCEDGLDIPW